VSVFFWLFQPQIPLNLRLSPAQTSRGIAVFPADIIASFCAHAKVKIRQNLGIFC
jgi:hypothetical protein